MLRIYPIFILLSFLIFPFETEAQKIDKLINFLTVHPNKKAAARDSTIYPAKAIFTPVVTYAPETKLSFGIGMKGLFKIKGSSAETRTSNIPLSVQYTIENKYLFFSGFQVFFPDEKYILAGNLRIQSFPSLFFGVGQNTQDDNEEEFSYSQILFEPLLLKHVFFENFYLGAGYRFKKINQVEAEPDGLLATSTQIGALGSTSSGIELAVMFDSRDNLLNAKEGLLLKLTHGFYGNYLGSSQNYQLTRMDLRYYIQPLKKPTSVLAFQILTHYSHDDTPLHELGRLGGDESMRGYFEGRFTERILLVTQAEWRQKLTHRWGVTAFAGLGGVAPKFNQFSLATIRPNIGVGVRFLIDNVEDLNLRLDFGAGERTSNYYFKIAEAF